MAQPTTRYTLRRNCQQGPGLPGVCTKESAHFSEAILRRQQLSWEPLDEGELARFDAHAEAPASYRMFQASLLYKPQVEIDVGVQAVDKAMKASPTS